jgi:hypothetical protein
MGMMFKEGNIHGKYYLNIASLAFVDGADKQGKAPTASLKTTDSYILGLID